MIEEGVEYTFFLEVSNLCSKENACMSKKTQFKKGEIPHNKTCPIIESKVVELFKDLGSIILLKKHCDATGIRLSQCTLREILKRNNVYEQPWSQTNLVDLAKGLIIGNELHVSTKFGMAIFDLDVVDKLSGPIRVHKRKPQKLGWSEYFFVSYKGRPIHRALLPNAKLIDHINRNPLDNRLSNLREATFAGNAANRAVSKKNKSGLKGVSSQSPTLHYARLRKGGVEYRFGPFKTAEEAHKIYLENAAKLHGDFCCG